MKYIHEQKLLDEACLLIEASSWVGVDTEADSLHHYHEKLCLLQLSIDKHDFVIDPLKNLDLSKLIQILDQKYVILHGADFDIRILKKFYSFNPKTIFDTMIAAQLLGYSKMGLADLALMHCNATLSKDNQKADWSRRPLDEDLLTYAANDTHYLKTIHDAMKTELEALKRLDWQRQSCDRLLKSLESASKETKVAPESPWQIKGSKILKGHSLTVLKHLWEWREKTASAKDRPSFKILNSEFLIAISDWAAKNPGQDIALMEGAPRNVKGDLREVLNSLLKEAQTLPPVPFVSKKTFFSGTRWGEKENKKLAEFKALREKIAADFKIHPSLVATNAVIEELISQSPKDLESMRRLDCLMPWQVDIAGDAFLKILNS